MFIVNCKSSSSVTLDLTSRDRYQLQLEISSEDPNINVSLPIESPVLARARPLPAAPPIEHSGRKR